MGDPILFWKYLLLGDELGNEKTFGFNPAEAPEQDGGVGANEKALLQPGPNFTMTYERPIKIIKTTAETELQFEERVRDFVMALKDALAKQTTVANFKGHVVAVADRVADMTVTTGVVNAGSDVTLPLSVDIDLSVNDYVLMIDVAGGDVTQHEVMQVKTVTPPDFTADIVQSYVSAAEVYKIDFFFAHAALSPTVFNVPETGRDLVTATLRFKNVEGFFSNN